MIHLSHNPDKLEAKALAYERKGKTAKAIKYREKAARLRGSAGGLGVAHTPTSIIPPAGVGALSHPVGSTLPAGYAPRTPAMYEANALKWEQRGNWQKAQKNREKVWRMRNPNYSTAPAPVFYRDNAFLGYDLQPSVITTLPTVHAPIASISGPDRNHDGIPDQLQGGGLGGIHHPGGLVGGVHQVGVPTASISGPDRNHDGIPDQLQGGLGGVHRPVGMVGGVHQAGIPSAYMAGPDRNHDGIPDHLQGGGGFAHGLSPLGGGYPLGGGFGNKKIRDANKMEAKAAEYERKGKINKAQKLRHKAERVRAGTYSSARTPDMYERNALKWEQRGNWEKAQKNRSKAWRHKYPQYGTHPAPSFYNSGRFLGYDIPVAGFNQGPLLGHGAPLAGGAFGAHGLDAMRPSRDPVRLEARAADWERRGKPQKAARLRNKAALLRAGTYTSQRTPDMYERNALKWEQRGNWDKAQKNRSKAWRLRNPQFAQHVGPSFYNNNTFLGYDIPFTPSDATLLPYYRTTTTTTYNNLPGATLLPGQSHILPGATYAGGAPHGGFHGLSSRNPIHLEERAIKAESRGKTAKAMKLRNKAAMIRAGQHSPRNLQAIEAKALHYEQQGNWKKAQRTREKIWRLQNPQFLTALSAPVFYNNNAFLGYNVPYTGGFSTTSTYSSVSSITSGIGQLGVGTQTIYAAPIVEQVVRPTIVTETQRAERIVEVQPIIHREVDAPELHLVEKHVYETVPSVGPTTVTNTAIVHETVTPRITEEVQAIVHREVPAPYIERVEQHVTEHIVQPVIQTKEVIQDTHMHIAAGAPITMVGGMGGIQHQVGAGVPMATVTGPDFNRDGIPDQLQGGAGIHQAGLVGSAHYQGGMVGGVHHVGVPTAAISGPDRNHDGIPDQLQGGMVGGIHHQGGLVGGFQHAGVPTASISGPDRNHDGIPDQLQGGHRLI